VQGFQGDLTRALDSGELAELKGIGRATLDVIVEVLRTGSSTMLQRLREQVPPGLVEMLDISGLGVQKIRQIHETLHIDSLDELEAAARDGRLAELPRFGPKTADKILKGIGLLRGGSEYRLLHHARQEAAALAEVLGLIPGVTHAAVAGTVRRSREVIRDLDFVLALEGPPGELVERLGQAAGVREFVDRTDRTVTLRFASGTVADIHWTSALQFGFHLLQATGNREHLAALEARAGGLGLVWSDACLLRDGRPVAAPTEEAVYAALDLPFIPPELREGRGEVAAAAAGALPPLLERDELQGFLHCHSEYSDGGSTVREWADACAREGYTYLGITDHSEAAIYMGGLSGDRIKDQHAEIDVVNAAQSRVRVLKGVEADILEDGTLDYTPEVRASFDFIIASVHNRLDLSREQMTTRILRAMDDPQMAILGHPTGRLLLTRDAYALDLDAVFEKATAVGVAIEINADPQRLDLDWRVLRRAIDAGVTISIGADAHGVAGLENMDIGVAIARKGWLTKDHVLNTRPPEGFLEHVARRRKRR
jgi:DNA polymerase (family 10)